MLLRSNVRRDRKRKGFVIIAVLMVITVLTLAAYQYSALMSAEVMAAERIRKTTEARASADSGVHYFTALAADSTAFEGSLSSNPFDNAAVFQSVMVKEGPSARGLSRFSLVSLNYADEAASGGNIPLRFGAADEAGKLNINGLFALDPSGKVLHDALMKLEFMTDEVAWSIVDWLDSGPSDSENPGGAESTYYGGLQPAYNCKNGPLDTLEELLLIKGVTPALLFGTDRNRNGKLDPGEDDGLGYAAGWAAFLTIYSRERNVDADGNPRVNLNGNDIAQLITDLEPVVGQELMTFIVAYRLFGSGTTAKKGGGGLVIEVAGTPGDLQERIVAAVKAGTAPRQRISSLFALVNAKVVISRISEAKLNFTGGGGKGGNSSMQVTTNTTFPSPLADEAKQVELLAKLLDKTTTQQGLELPARVNVNTAPREVLMGLPGMTDAVVDMLIAKRPTYLNGEAPEPRFATVAWLLDGTVPIATLQGLERYVTARTQVYRVQSIGYFDEGGPMTRVEAVIDTNQGQPRIVYYRDLTDLGRSIDPRSLNR